MKFTYSLRKLVELFANSGDPDQMPGYVASDLGLCCLPITLLWVFRLQCVKNVSVLQSAIQIRCLLSEFGQCIVCPDNKALI